MKSRENVQLLNKVGSVFSYKIRNIFMQHLCSWRDTLITYLWRGLLMFAFAFPQWHTDWLIKRHFLISSLFFSLLQVCFSLLQVCVCVHVWEKETVIKSIHLGTIFTRFFLQNEMQHPHNRNYSYQHANIICRTITSVYSLVQYLCNL